LIAVGLFGVGERARLCFPPVQVFPQGSRKPFFAFPILGLVFACHADHMRGAPIVRKPSFP